MFTAGSVFICAAVIASAMTPIVRNAARNSGLLDDVLGSRRVHGQPVPRLGGVAIVVAFVAALAGLLLVDREVGFLYAAHPHRMMGLVLGGALIAALGVYDDVRGANARLKLGVQFAVAALVYAFGHRIDCVAVPLVGSLELGILGFPLTVLWIAGVTNAVNLIDGLDGLAGGVAFIASAVLFVLAFGRGDALLMLLTASLAGAVLGFLFFNLNPASIFMGDSGSLFLGFILATASIATRSATSTGVMLLVPIVLLGIPIADTLLSIGRRALRGAPLFSADRGHIHHRLLARGLTHRQSVRVLYGVACVLAMVALALADASDGEALVAVALLGLAGFVVLRLLGFFDWTRFDDLLEQRRRNRAVRFSIAEIGQQLREAAEPQALWSGVLAVVPVLGAHHASLRVSSVGDGAFTYTTQAGCASADMLRARFSVQRERSREHLLELGWADGRTALDRDTELAVEQLCEYLSSAIDRMDLAREGDRMGPSALAVR